MAGHWYVASRTHINCHGSDSSPTTRKLFANPGPIQIYRTKQHVGIPGLVQIEKKRDPRESGIGPPAPTSSNDSVESCPLLWLITISTLSCGWNTSCSSWNGERVQCRLCLACFGPRRGFSVCLGSHDLLWRTRQPRHLGGKRQFWLLQAYPGQWDASAKTLVFQDDSVPVHRAWPIHGFIRDEEVEQLPWSPYPPFSPYLNPIKHLWNSSDRATH